ncbi:ATP-binding protein [Streptomyces sp. NPDC004539]|uniref:sensor histidine kinase n=1 Tax=Streptomyces sp. NPDC004539 TaxID=3154280 RepID=UPI0033AA758E
MFTHVSSRPAAHRRPRPEPDRFVLGRFRVAVLLAQSTAVLAAGVAAVGGWLVSPVVGLAGVVGGLVAAVAVGEWLARVGAGAVGVRWEGLRAAEGERVVAAAVAVEKTVRWSTEELLRGVRPPVPEEAVAVGVEGALARTLEVLEDVKQQCVIALVDVEEASRSSVLLELLRRLPQRQHPLLDRMLRALSALEAETDDPELLDRIYQIDHLATRLRRRVESSAILGGASLRRATEPMRVATVLHGAVCEVEHYRRVAVEAGGVGVGFALPKQAGPDVMHLMAELIENGLEFSAPETRVEVSVAESEGGLTIRVTDRGLPMPPARRDRLNRLLASPYEADLARLVREGQVGLVTVSTIAREHRLTVRLVENPGGGTTALVGVPAHLLLRVLPLTSPDVPAPAAPAPAVSRAVPAPAGPRPSRPPARQPVAGPPGKEGGVPALPRRIPAPPPVRPTPAPPRRPADVDPGRFADFRAGQRAGRDHTHAAPPDS